MSTLVPHTWTNSNGKLSPTGIVKGGGKAQGRQPGVDLAHGFFLITQDSLGVDLGAKPIQYHFI